MENKRRGLLWRIVWPAILGILGLILLLVAAERFWPKAAQPQALESMARHMPLAASPEARNQYRMELSLDDENQLLSGRSELQYINNNAKEQKSLVLHLYPNAFSTKENTPVSLNEFTQNYPNGFSAGGIELTEALVEGKRAACELSPDGQHVTLHLAEPLGEGEKVRVSLSYIIRIPQINNRFGYGEVAYSFAQFYPVFAVYDEEGWHTEPYTLFGDPFYFDVSDYQVTLHVPTGYEVACTGNVVSDHTADGIRTLNIEAASVREFVFACGKKWTISSKKAGRVQVLAYARDAKLGERLADAGAKALELYGKRFGSYPYQQLSIVETDLYGGGMEYPNVVAIDTQLYSEGSYDALLYTTVHEVAHQWWYVYVGNNQIAEPWLDEGLTEYSTYLYFREYYPAEQAEALFELNIRMPYESMEKRLKGETHIDRALTEYGDVYSYAAVAYWRGAMMFRALHEELGDAVFYKALHNYTAWYGFGNATRESLVEVFSHAAGKDMSGFFARWLDE